MSSSSFVQKYGPWALIAGGALGLGEAWANALASRGLNIASIDRNLAALYKQKEELKLRFGVDVRSIHADLTHPDVYDEVVHQTSDLEVGIMVYSAAMEVDPARMAPHLFLDGSLQAHRDLIAINVSGPCAFAYHFGALMKERGHGGLVLISSGADGQGSPFVVNYGASKAYMTVLAEGLWFELAPHGVDVIAAPLGLTRTTALANFPHVKAMAADDAVEAIIDQLGKRPQVVPGRKNSLQQSFVKRIMPKKRAIRWFANIHLNNFLRGNSDYDLYRN